MGVIVKQSLISLETAGAEVPPGDPARDPR
jgi:hypothetical protein